MGDNYWELTIAVLQDAGNPLVDKPKLSEKYLTKPPFRFLHDVISAVQAKTGFAPGLFQGDELDGKALQDKDAKVTYLTKIINVVSFVLGEPVPAKPLKVVAGLEPENTNVFLQMLGKAAQRGDAAAFVQKVLAGEQPGAAAEKPKAKAKPKPKPAAEAAPAAEAPAAEAPPPPAEKPAEKPKKTKPKPAAPPPEEAPPPPPPPAEEEKPKEKKSSRSSTSGSKSKPPKEEDAPLPAPAAEPADPLNASAGSATAAAQKSLGRPQSARKAPPKLPAQTPPPAPSIVAATAAAAAPAAAPGARPGTASRRGPEPAAAKPIMLFEEGAKGDDDDDVEVVHERRPVAIGAVPEGEQGVLVKNILEAEKALKKTRDEGEESGNGSGGIILGRLGKASAPAGGVKAGDHAGIREMVQKLTQSSHPLAKSMDYLQEDLENMAKEYRFWVTERRVFQEKLGDEQRMASDQAAADARLADLEGQVRQVRDRTLGLKAQILRNDETISKLLAMAVSGGR